MATIKSFRVLTYFGFTIFCGWFWNERRGEKKCVILMGNYYEIFGCCKMRTSLWIKLNLCSYTDPEPLFDYIHTKSNYSRINELPCINCVSSSRHRNGKSLFFYLSLSLSKLEHFVAASELNSGVLRCRNALASTSLFIPWTHDCFFENFLAHRWAKSNTCVSVLQCRWILIDLMK